MNLKEEIEHLRDSLLRAERIQMELDRRVFYLKTLYDVSKDIFASVECEPILKNFLLMTMGNFGVVKGFILTADMPSLDIRDFVFKGFQPDEVTSLSNSCKTLLLKLTLEGPADKRATLKNPAFLPAEIVCVHSFKVDSNCEGLLGLGAKLVNEPFNEDDEELLKTLVNNLVIALKNARSFEEINSLNLDLQEKNIQLENALSQLKSSMRKVELLESIKENLSKFVPVTVCRMIEKSPTNTIPKSRKQDVSVLFLDIEGYTKLCEKLGSSETSEVIEKHFSAFMDAIYINNGDVNETAGDGLMVLFLNEDQQTNAIEAVRAALKIREEAVRICDDCSMLYRPLDINMGINSGQAFVGATKFETYSGSRWTYTARGSLTNMASRIGAQATGGSIYLSKTTANRIKGFFSPVSIGKFKLKNVSEEVEIFKL